MDEFALRLRSRFVPAVLSALGVALLTAGLLTYTTPVEAGPEDRGGPKPDFAIPTGGYVFLMPYLAQAAVAAAEMALAMEADPAVQERQRDRMHGLKNFN